VAKVYRHIILVEVETSDAELDQTTLQESILEVLDALPDVTVAVVEDRVVSGIYRRTP
jgi:hypothetical protein